MKNDILVLFPTCFLICQFLKNHFSNYVTLLMRMQILNDTILRGRHEQITTLGVR